MTDDDLICSAFAAGRKAERMAVADWLQSKAYFTLAQLVRAGLPEIEGPGQIRPMTDAERKRAADRSRANGGGDAA